MHTHMQAHVHTRTRILSHAPRLYATVHECTHTFYGAGCDPLEIYCSFLPGMLSAGYRGKVQLREGKSFFSFTLCKRGNQLVSPTGLSVSQIQRSPKSVWGREILCVRLKEMIRRNSENVAIVSFLSGLTWSCSTCRNLGLLGLSASKVFWS